MKFASFKSCLRISIKQVVADQGPGVVRRPLEVAEPPSAVLPDSDAEAYQLPGTGQTASGGVVKSFSDTVTGSPSCFRKIDNNNNNNDNVYGAVIMTKVVARVHSVHLMNVD